MVLKRIIQNSLHDTEMLTALIRAWWRLSDAQIRRCRSTDPAWNKGQAAEIVSAYACNWGLCGLQHDTHIRLMQTIAQVQIGA